MKINSFFALALSVCLGAGCATEDNVGKRPYEMDWAGRTEDDWPPVVDFEADWQWKVETKESVASFERSREQQLFGKYVGKLVYRATGTGNKEVVVRPPKPVPVPKNFDMVGCWIYGNNWAWVRDPKTPRVNVSVLYGLPDGKEIDVHLCQVNWKEWFLPLRRLDAEQQKLLSQPGVVFTGFKVKGGGNKEDRALYFDSLTMHKEEFKPLEFKPRPKRGVEMFPGQGTGANNGPGVLPFPTREDTILPSSAAPGSANASKQDNGYFMLTYHGTDGVLEVRYKPETGRWDDIQFRWNNGDWFWPLYGGGALFADRRVPQSAEHLNTKLEGGSIKSIWRYVLGDESFEATYTMQLKGKTLVLDTQALGGTLGAVAYGGAKGLDHPRAFQVPYYDYAAGRPGTVVSGSPEQPLYYSAHTDWYRSNASTPWGESRVADDGIAYANGGVKYIPKTDGKRNDCFERFFITVSPRFEETLPNLPNPKSPWKHVAGTHQWRAHGAGNRDSDKAYWRSVWRLGMRQVLVTDHEVCWRDGGESFTFRTKAAPAKGGDEGMRDYAKFMQETLGFVYGPYNNFTDFAPVNEYWRTDIVSRMADNQLQPAWARCYGPKPQYAVEYCAELSPINQEKFHFSTAYCDVHTSVTPWGRCDYDYRVPGAGTFAATYYAYGEIMLHQKKAWNGPVYSEGPHFCFYSGLTDGNYAQDRSYHIPTRPWLVDFDLRKIHEQECNFGMGNEGMFYGEWYDAKKFHGGIDGATDRFLAATLAFGHPGFLVSDGSLRRTMRGYFMLQQLHSRYTQCSVDTIGYVDAKGGIFDTSAAIANGVYERSQLVIRYQDGTNVVVNGNSSKRMKVSFRGRDFDLPPNGYAGWTDDGKIEVLSSDANGARSDYAATPDYIYVDGRDKLFQRFPMAAGIGAAACRRVNDSTYEYIPWHGADCGWKLPVVSAVALDKEMNEIGAATVRYSRGYAYVIPVANAFSYLLTLGEAKRETELSCKQDVMAAGEELVVRGDRSHVVTVPLNAVSGQRLWFNLEGKWIDFTVKDLADVDIVAEGTKLTFNITSNRPELRQPECMFEGQTQIVKLDNSGRGSAAYTIELPAEQQMRGYDFIIKQDKIMQRFRFGVISRLKPMVYPVDWTADFDSGICRRGEKETTVMAGSGASASKTSMECGQDTKTGIFMHPPYMGGVGYTYVTKKVTVPTGTPVMFRSFVGKRNGCDPGDGIWFYVYVIEANGNTVKVAEASVQEHMWKPIEADLTPWAGQNVRVKLVSDVGPNDNSEGDWSCWGDIRLETKNLQMTSEIDRRDLLYVFETTDDYVAGLTMGQLRQAKRGWLCYEGQGLNSAPGSYESYGVVNDVEIGLLRGSDGDETKNLWNEEVRNEISQEALKKMVKYNYIQIRNPNHDYFKLRRFRIVLEMPDGRMVSSKVMSSAITQPGDWRYAEGYLFNLNETVTIPIEF